LATVAGRYGEWRTPTAVLVKDWERAGTRYGLA